MNKNQIYANDTKEGKPKEGKPSQTKPSVPKPNQTKRTQATPKNKIAIKKPQRCSSHDIVGLIKAIINALVYQNIHDWRRDRNA